MMGGCQNYISGKSAYLEECGWDVFVLYAGIRNCESCAFPQLEKYEFGNIPQLRWVPGELPTVLQGNVLRKMKKKVTKYEESYDITVIESHDDKTALWGELLARDLQAKHMCFNCNELFRGRGKFYERYIDFFLFKHSRKELAGISAESLNNLFQGYKVVSTEENYTFYAAYPDSVQNMGNEFVSKIKKCDWNICYIGRIQKSYVENILNDVAVFAKMHRNKTINFVFVGDVKARKELINEIFINISNVKLTFLGDMVPIPRELFSIIDVVIAGSGCAICAAAENVPTIIPDPENGKSNGLLGYETQSYLYNDGKCKQSTFDVALERVLVKKIHTELTFEFEFPQKSSYYYDQHMKFIEESDDSFSYYNTEDICKNKMNLSTKVKRILAYYIR